MEVLGWCPNCYVHHEPWYLTYRQGSFELSSIFSSANRCVKQSEFCAMAYDKMADPVMIWTEESEVFEASRRSGRAKKPPYLVSAP